MDWVSRVFVWFEVLMGNHSLHSLHGENVLLYGIHNNELLIRWYGIELLFFIVPCATGCRDHLAYRFIRINKRQSLSYGVLKVKANQPIHVHLQTGSYDDGPHVTFEKGFKDILTISQTNGTERTRVSELNGCATDSKCDLTVYSQDNYPMQRLFSGKPPKSS